jgi:thiamine pyrophosphate-dependent acetolactate synthase large subunit-like protein
MVNSSYWGRYAATEVNRIECLEAFAAVRGDAAVIVGPGFAGHELAAASQSDLTIYNMEMGYAASMCLGLALALEPSGRRVVAIEGDGSMLMALPTLTTMSRYPARNLAVVVFDNGVYLTTGRGAVASATAGHGASLSTMARGAGETLRVEDVTTLKDFRAAMTQAMSMDGPWMVVAHVDASDRRDPRARQHFDTDIPDQAALFRRALA